MNKTQKEQIKRLRLDGLGYIKVAQALGLSENTVKSYCRRNNLSGSFRVSSNQSATEKCFCKNCGKEIIQTPKRKPRQFCSDICRSTFWKVNQDKIVRKKAVKYVCPVCNNTFFDYSKNSRKFCSHKCYIKDRYKGGALHE